MKCTRFFWLALGIGIGFLVLQAMPRVDFLGAEVGVLPGPSQQMLAPPNNDIPPPLAADEPEGAGGDYSMEAVRIENSANGEALCIFEHATKRLAIYQISNGGLEVWHLRNCSYDFQVNAFDHAGRTSSPTVAEVREALKKK